MPMTSATELQSPSVRGSFCVGAQSLLSSSCSGVQGLTRRRRPYHVRPKTARLMNSASAQRSKPMTSTINVADVERWASALGGAALTAYGIKQLKDRSPAGAALAAAGSALMYRGATGHCPVYAAAGINTADDGEGHARGAGRRARRQRRRGRHDQRARPTELYRVLAQLRAAAAVHGPPRVGAGSSTNAARTGSRRRPAGARSSGTPRSSTRFPAS